ncbi:MAG: hypothetical protein HOQ05_12640 [Corynebacteriales bacterium]|nr:hypothetical protein [Mycobacteriales bacterium]
MDDADIERSLALRDGLDAGEQLKEAFAYLARLEAFDRGSLRLLSDRLARDLVTEGQVCLRLNSDEREKAQQIIADRRSSGRASATHSSQWRFIETLAAKALNPADRRYEAGIAQILREAEFEQAVNEKKAFASSPRGLVPALSENPPALEAQPAEVFTPPGPGPQVHALRMVNPPASPNSGVLRR